MSTTRQELEMLIAGNIIVNPVCKISSVDIDAEDFTLNYTSGIIKTARHMMKEGKFEIDPIIIRANAENLGIELSFSDISSCVNSVISSKNFNFHIEELKKLIYNDKIKALKQWGKARILEVDIIEFSNDMTAKEMALSNKYLTNTYTNTLPETYADVVTDIENRVVPEGLVKTHNDILDELSGGGFMPNEYVVIAARPGGGKTAFALQTMSSMALHDTVSSFFSLEMDERQNATRLISFASKQNTKLAVRNPTQVSQHIIDKIVGATGIGLNICESILLHDEPNQTIYTIGAQARKDVKNGSKSIWIDYLQLLSTGNKKRNDAIGEFSNYFKNLAKELGVPIFILSQMNRSIEEEKRTPRLSDLRDSGSIEQDANTILFLHPQGEKRDNGFNVLAIQAKGRDTGVGIINSFFNTDSQTFTKVAKIA